MLSTVYILVAIAAAFCAVFIRLFQRYFKNKGKPDFFFGIACFFWMLSTIFGILMVAATSLNNLSLVMLFYQFSTTMGVSGYVFLNMFAIALAKPGEKMRGIWISFACFLVITFIVWVFNASVAGVINGTTEFTLTSTYKPPYGLPLVETVLASMVVMAIYPIYLFFHIPKSTKERGIKIKSLWMGIGLLIATVAYAIEVTDAISYIYMPIYRPMIFVGIFILIFSYNMPKMIERKLAGHTLEGEESVKSFVEKFFVEPAAPNIRTQPHAFSKTFGLNHPQITGRKVLLEFDPVSHYEKVIHDFVTEALANVEPTFIFTRRGSNIHSFLSEQKAVKFFCLTQQVNVPRVFSENEMLLPSNDTSLMLNALDQTLKTHPDDKISIVFDSLSDLVLSFGLEKTYNFVKYAADMLSSPRITALFLLNQTAHNPNVSSSLRGLFSNQISIEKDGIHAIKLPKTETAIMTIEKVQTKQEVNNAKKTG